MLKVLAKATEQSAQEQRVAERRGGSQQIPVCIQPNVEIFGPFQQGKKLGNNFEMRRCRRRGPSSSAR
jgi:hypothetical protein